MLNVIHSLAASGLLLAAGDGDAGEFAPKYAVFWTIGILTALMIVLHKFAWPHILAVLDEREAKIKESLELAEKARLESAKIFEDHKRLVAEAREEAQKVLEHGRVAAEDAKNKVMDEAKQEAESMLERAKKEIDLAEQKARAGLRDEVVHLTMAAAGKVIGRVLDDEGHRQLVKDCISEVDRLRAN